MSELHSTPLRSPVSRGSHETIQTPSVHPVPERTPPAVLAEIAVRGCAPWVALLRRVRSTAGSSGSCF